MTERKGDQPSVAWSWPDDQRVTYKVTPDQPGGLAGVSIAKQMLAICKLLESPEDGLRWKVMLIAIYTETDGSLVFELGLAPKKSAISALPSTERSPTGNVDGGA